MTVDADRLRGQVDAPVVHHETIPSTNDISRARGRDGALHGTFVVADEQTAGRGRSGNRWASPPGGVWSSILVRPDFDASHVGRLTFAGGLAAAETVEAFGVDARLKWPNDVVVDASGGDSGSQRKLCGVLTEAVVDEVPVAGKPVDEVLPETDPADAKLSFAVLGVGVNADLAPETLDVERDVTTLRAGVGDVDPTDVATTLHDRLLDWVERVETDDGFADALDEWRTRSATLGERVRVELRDSHTTRDSDTTGDGDTTHDGPKPRDGDNAGGGDTVVGTATGVTPRGALVVDTGDERVDITEGECARLRRT